MDEKGDMHMVFVLFVLQYNLHINQFRVPSLSSELDSKQYIQSWTQGCALNRICQSP